jgi:hypothetical protein
MNRLESGAPAPTADQPLPLSSYSRDFALWLRAQATLLRERNFELLDVNNLAEEVEGMARKEHHELRHRLKVLLAHLLKCKFQPDHRSRHWLATLREQRSQISELIHYSPSLKPQLTGYADEMYAVAADLAALESGLPLSTFPQSNPFSPTELLDPSFVP